MKLVRFAALALLIATLLVLGACAGKTIAPAPEPTVAPTATAEPTAAPTPTPEPTPTPVPTPTPTPEPKVRSWTSGVATEGGADPVHQPAIVSIENSSAARPQFALNMADIVYEFAVESAITRFQVLFNDNLPAYAGPVRSARYYFVDLQSEWAAMYVHEGYGPPSGEYKLKSKLISIHIQRSKQVNGIWCSRYFWRNKENKATEHRLMVNVKDLVTEIYGASDYVVPTHERFRYMENVVYDGSQSFTKVTIPFFIKEAENQIYYTYDAAANKLFRFQDGEPFMTRTPAEDAGKDITKVTLEPVSVQNLVVQHITYGKMSKDAKGRRTADVVGEGKCDYFINGQHVTGTWSRPSIEEATTYYLDNGEVVLLEPGNTWIEMHPSAEEYAITVE